jgi:MFS family permease
VWSDRTGQRKPFVLAGIAAAAAGALVMGLATDPWVMWVGRALSGVGAAGWVAFTVLFASYFPPHRSSRALGFVAFLSSFSIMLGSFSGGIISAQLGWTAPFFVAAALGLAAFVAAMAMYEKPQVPRRGVTPSQLLGIIRVPRLLAASTVSALSTWTLWAVTNTFTPLYAAQLGAGRSDLGILATVAQLANMSCTLVAPYVAERIGITKTLAAGIVIQALGSLMVPFVGSFDLLVASQVLGGGGRALLYPVTMAMAVNAVGPSDRATAMGMYQAVYALGMFAGPATSGFFGDAFGLSSVFFVGAVMTLAGIPIILTISSKQESAK